MSLAETSHWKEIPENNLYISFAVNSFVKMHRSQRPFVHLQQTRHQLSLNGEGLRGLEVDSVNFSSD
jgi:hypothetical protein